MSSMALPMAASCHPERGFSTSSGSSDTRCPARHDPAAHGTRTGNPGIQIRSSGGRFPSSLARSHPDLPRPPTASFGMAEIPPHLGVLYDRWQPAVEGGREHDLTYEDSYGFVRDEIAVFNLQSIPLQYPGRKGCRIKSPSSASSSPPATRVSPLLMTPKPSPPTSAAMRKCWHGASARESRR